VERAPGAIGRDEDPRDEDQHADAEQREQRRLQRFWNLSARRGEHFARRRNPNGVKAPDWCGLFVRSGGVFLVVFAGRFLVVSAGVFLVVSAGVFLAVSVGSAAPTGAPGFTNGAGRVGAETDGPGTSAPVSPGRPCVVSAGMLFLPCSDRR